jgi:hypothetical protein
MQKIIKIQCGNPSDTCGATLTEGLMVWSQDDSSGDKIAKAFVKLPQVSSNGFATGVCIAMTIQPNNTQSIGTHWTNCGYSTSCLPLQYWSDEDLAIYLENKSTIDTLKIIETVKTY